MHDACSSQSRTSMTLLGRLAHVPPDEIAWQQFLELYRPRIEAICAHRGLQMADAHDVSQNILLRLTQVMRRFKYDENGKFRNWLRRVTENAVSDFQKAVRNTAIQNAAWEGILSDEARRDFLDELEASYDMELLLTARQIVSQSVAPTQWTIFVAMVDQSLSAAQVAELHNISISNAYAIKSRIQKMLRLEINKLQ